MRIISRKMIRDFAKSDPVAVKPLDEWYRRLKKTVASNLAELRQTFPTADQVGTCTVFNVGGNKYRIITKIVYRFRTVYLREVLNHKEYDKGKWKTGCTDDSTRVNTEKEYAKRKNTESEEQRPRVRKSFGRVLAGRNKKRTGE
ncbi:MAG: hypothetical protein DMF63_10890 [Acidobacteria bacterium]|nr:MAG: hypothetical protein DMF63_10890 [Acidobacteriota bacterium]